MATLATNNLTLADWAKRQDPNNQPARIIELLSQSNEIIEDMVFKEGNLPTGHRTTVRSGLPDVAWRKLNYGVQPSKSTTVQVDDTCGMLESWSVVDKDLAELNGDVGAFRMSEATAFIEGMNQEFAQTLIYGNSGTEPEAFTGLALRYSSTSAANGQNILSGGGASGNTSVWLVGWGDNTVHGIYPKGTTAGLQHTDRGLEVVTDAAGGKLLGYHDRFQWKCGLALRDWRYAVRIANINVADLASLTTTQAATAATELIKLMSRSIDRIPNFGGIRPVFYANRTVRSLLRIQAMQKSSAALAVEAGLSQFGMPMTQMSFQGIPIRLCDAILNNEAAIA
jgi:hypothetical protein